MAAIAVSRARAWHKAETTYLNLKQQLEVAPAADVDALERQFVAAQDAMMELAAPSFLAIRRKLEILWEIEMDAPDRAGTEKSLILEDLTDLVDEAAATLGFERAFADIC